MILKKRSLWVLLCVMITIAMDFGELAAVKSITQEPVMVISGKRSKLNRPEAVVFSPSGDCIAIANSDGNLISIYPRIGDEECHYEKTPCSLIQSDADLAYVHDLSFSPDGMVLAAASRNSNAVTFYKRMNANSCHFETKPFYKMKGKEAGLYQPTGICYSPKGDLIAVCNRMGGSGVTLYSLNQKSMVPFKSVPHTKVTEDRFLTHEISAPHGLAFSHDGSHITTVHKRYFKNDKGCGFCALSNIPINGNSVDFKRIHYHFYDDKSHLHSINYHPSGEYMIVSDCSSSEVVIHKKEAESGQFFPHSSLYIDKKGGYEGPKGVAFSTCGRFFALTTVLNEVFIYDFVK